LCQQEIRGKEMLNGKRVIILGCLFGFVLFGTSYGAAKKKVKVNNNSRFEKLELFNRVLYLVESQYYRKVDAEKLIEGAIKGMMSTLDPHSSFLREETFKKMQEDTSGEFGGIGIEVTQKDGVIIVVTPIEDTPAFNAGVKAGDRIVEINGVSVVGSTLEDTIEKMRGKLKGKITLGVAREGTDGVLTLEMRREIIKTKSVKSEVIDDHYIYLRLTQFQKRSSKDMTKAIIREKNKIKKSKKELKGIVLDLRNNPGGLLDEAVNVSSIFLKDGVVVSTESRDPKQKEIRYVKKTGYKETSISLVVLINGSSASASEIVAGALQDHKRALIIGSGSFGKGSVQTIAKVDDKQGVKLTIAQYMTPLGRKIQAIGIQPDLKISDFEAEWEKENRIDGKYMRERDLQNHLNATIETDEEKKARVERERIEKKERIAKIRELRKKRKEKKGKTAKNSERKLRPSKDYQVIRAIDTLKSYEAFKKISNL